MKAAQSAAILSPSRRTHLPLQQRNRTKARNIGVKRRGRNNDGNPRRCCRKRKSKNPLGTGRRNILNPNSSLLYTARSRLTRRRRSGTRAGPRLRRSCTDACRRRPPQTRRKAELLSEKTKTQLGVDQEQRQPGWEERPSFVNNSMAAA